MADRVAQSPGRHWERGISFGWRRALVVGATLATTVVATTALHSFLSGNGITVFDRALLVLFPLTFAWIAFSFWASLLGMAAHLGLIAVNGLRPPDPGSGPSGRTVLLMPIYNEDPARVFAGIQAIWEDLSDLQGSERFDLFILSDSTSAAHAQAEALAWHRLVEATGAAGRIFYRRRERNVGRKAGNIADFLTRWGNTYDYAVILDADSLMSGETLIELARLMDANPRTGLIQVPPRIVNRHSFFARLLQFANAVYGPIFTAGIAAWQGDAGNYWGHNAIVRTRAFMACCGLPTLKGRKPFGGHILSHDFVEAALLRRGGWEVWLEPRLGGSYEESPPTLVDYAVRDRRWCQGNLQHMKVIGAAGLHPISRLHLLMGIMSYLASPLWLLFLIGGVTVATLDRLVLPDYFAGPSGQFPTWPVIDTATAAFLLVTAFGMLAVPRLIGVIIAAMSPRQSQSMGGPGSLTISATLELLVSTLLSPIFMLLQSGFVISILAGRDTGWRAQRRDDGGGLSWGEACRYHALHSGIGLLLAMGLWYDGTALFLWLAPVWAGLLLAIPLSWLTSRVGVGRGLQALDLLLVPEESSPPPVLIACRRLVPEWERRLAGLDDPSGRSLAALEAATLQRLLEVRVGGAAS